MSWDDREPRLGPRPPTKDDVNKSIERFLAYMKEELPVPDKIKGYLEVGSNEKGEIVINHLDLKPDANGAGHIVFSTTQARNLADSLLRQSDKADRDMRAKRDAERMNAAAQIPVDRNAQTLTNGSPVTEDHRELLQSGQQKGYVVLSAEERAKGFVRPVRRSYRHKTCGAVTTMGLALAETYARDPKFYNGTFCATCLLHFPLDQFVWEDTTEQVGS